MSEPIQSIAQNNYILQAPTPTATMFTTELEYDGDKISGYAGSAFKAGTDLEFGYTDADTISSINNSAITDASLNNIVQTNSGSWGGSALPVSAGPGIKVNLVDNTLVFSNDETVLWETDSVYGAGVCNLSESLKNFEQIGILATRGYTGTDPGGMGPWSYWNTDGISADGADYHSVSPFIFEGYNWKNSCYSADATFTTLTWYRGGQMNILSTTAGTTANSFTGCVGIKKVIGINRK